jgi:MarR family transcriptional regulator, negative regulator of the multidrug operon emrRAB
MKGIERLTFVESTTPRMAKALPEMPMAGVVMVRLLRISAFGMGNFFEPVFRAMGMSEHGFHVLCLLVSDENGCLSPSDLSEMVGTSRGNMTHILNDLMSSDYIARAVSPRDGRRHIIQITDAGHEKVRDMVPQIIAPINHAFSGLTEPEMKTLDSLLRKLIKSFDTGALALKASPSNHQSK